MKKKVDKKILLAIILLITVLISTISATYAYFTASGSGELSNFKLQSREFGVAYTESGSNIDLLVDGDVMKYENIDPVIPAATATNVDPVRIILETTADGGTLSCNYDIVYVPTTPYNSSAMNTAKLNEYTIKGSSDRNGKSLSEISLADITSEFVLVDNSKISVTGVNKKLIENWTFTVSYYNQTFNQDDNRNITFGGSLNIKNLECENTIN